jgi:rhomboid protease GluP
MEEHDSDKDEAHATIDLTGYSIQQLRELRALIDEKTHPESLRRLLAALAKKESLAESEAANSQIYVGRFTSRDGLLGWLQAKRHRSPLYGAGTVEVESGAVLLSGWQRTWLGVPIQAQLTRQSLDVSNAVQDGSKVWFEIKRRRRYPERICFDTASLDRATDLSRELPETQASGFLHRWSEIRDFSRSLRAVSKSPLVVTLLLALNILVFIAMSISTKKVVQFDVQETLRWGANFGPLTVNGDWWRLLSAIFVHAGLLHLSLNMWALWNIGRITEKLFGRITFLFLYLGAGTLASLTSIAWDPSLSSVGASGAIFGLFGAFLAFLLRERAQIPPSIVRRHWISTLVFVLFNLVDGAITPGIDNAAHVGGLLSGFLLGYVLARPLRLDARAIFPLRECIAAAALAMALFAAAFAQIGGAGSELTVPERFAQKHGSFINGELQNLHLWEALATRASAGTISMSELGDRFEREILPFWKTEVEQLANADVALRGPDRAYALLVEKYAGLRYRWANAIIETTRGSDSSAGAQAVELMKETTAVNAQIERLAIRSRMDHRKRGLTDAPVTKHIKLFITGYGRACVTPPAAFEPPIAPTDAKSDGPAMRHMLGCRAQELFLRSDYAKLESVLIEHAGRLGDLPDGSSSYEGMFNGLANLLRYGGMSADNAFEHTADWRDQIPDSTMSELVEAMVFEEWAWSARGSAAAASVSNQNMAIYNYRAQMADAALADIPPRSRANPAWYALSLRVGLDLSRDKEKAQAIFDQGFIQFPTYHPLYRQMLRILMPRWLGSYDDVDRFVNYVRLKFPQDRGYEPYAELYTTYARLEGDDTDIFRDGRASWTGMRSGYLGLIKRYPNSDFILNSFANFACRAADMDEYSRLQNTVKRRFSSTAWTGKFTFDACNEILAKSTTIHSQSASHDIIVNQISSLGGVRLGMTREELLAAKGRPNQETELSWVYQSSHLKANGLLTVYFSKTKPGEASKVESVGYAGDSITAPSEVPYLIDLSPVQVITMYGAQIAGHLTLRGEMTYAFRNGVYVYTHDEKVYRYGIFLTPRTANSSP